MDSFGWSLFTNPDESILIGGPAVVRGRLLKVRPHQKKLLYMNGKDSSAQYNFGYSVTSGSFFKSTTNVYAVGSTYAFGQVTFVVDYKSTMKKIYSISGVSLGSMFGAVLCPAFLQPSPATLGDPRATDLLVGAPTFATSDGYNVGAVYVVTGTTIKDRPTLQRSIVGARSSSFFGSAIASLGDINNDKIDEIAIAAPYESEGRGTVYLYSGADLMTKGVVHPIQTIVPESTLSLKTFGYSLTVLRDYDDNGCNELAIGSPESNKVMVLRCMAAITVKLLHFQDQLPATNGMDRTETLSVCLKATFPDKPASAEANIQVDINIDHNDVTLSGLRKQETVKILVRRRDPKKKTESFCQNVALMINGLTGHFNKEIMYDLKASLLDSPIDKIDFKGSDVILNENSLLSVSGNIWVQECGSVKCVPKLNMTTSCSGRSRYVIGSSPSINVTAWVQNQGEVAYDACVRMRVVGARVSDDAGACAALDGRDDQLECAPRQLLRNNLQTWLIDGISVDTTQLTSENDKVTVNVELYNECKTDDVTQQASCVFDLYADSDSVDVNGRTNEGLSDIVNITRIGIATQKTFEHVYTISNGGPTTWVNVNIFVAVQKLDFVTRSVYVQQQECEAESSTDTEDSLMFSCLAATLDSHAEIEAKVVMQIVADKINNRIDKERLTVRSEIMVQLAATFKHANVTSELRLVEGKVPVWIIVAASILALILLVIIFFILRECGLLKRKTKEQLNQVRMSVRRQTIMRQSMMNQSGSQGLLLDSSEASASQDNQKKKKDRRVVVNDF